MNILYKYYSSGFDVISHLTSPAMKLSHVASFNDPFEKRLSTAHAQSIANNLMVAINNSDQSVRDNFRETYRNINSTFGVISLSETHRNLLMWAHYASSHKGVCIGYKADFFDGLKKLPPLFDSLNIDYNPQRVIYDAIRFDPERLSYTPNQLYISLRKKSDEWIYEKEHRCIIPYLWADKIQVSINAEPELNQAIGRLITNKCLSIGNNDREFIFNDLPSCYGDKLDLSSLHDSVSMLKNINLESIDSIYLGSLYGKEQENKIKEYMLSHSEKCSHISLYKYDVDDNEFKLNINPLLNSKLQAI